MSSILTNTSAMVALQTLRGINDNLAKTTDMISTGKRVATAKDNAAIFAISKVMESDVAGFKSISESLALGSSTIAVASNATNKVGDLLEEIKGKIVASNEDNVDRSVLQNEIDELRNQITGIVGAAQFNGKNLLLGGDQVDILASLDRSTSGAVTSNSIGVNGRDFSTTAGTYGTGPATFSTSVSGTGVTAAASTLTLTNGANYLGANTFALQVGSFNLSFVAADLAASGAAGTTDDDFAVFLADQINALGIEGLTATATQGGTGNSTVALSSTSSQTMAIAAGPGNTVAAFTGGSISAASLAGSSGATNTAATETVTFSGTAPSVAAGETIDFSLGDQTFTYTNTTGAGIATSAALATNIAAYYNANADLQVAGVTFADAGSGVLTIGNTDSSRSLALAVDMSGVTTAPGATTLSAAAIDAATAGTSNVGIGGGTVNEGDSFRVTINGNNYDYIAGANDTVNDVARGLQSVIAADGPADVSTTITFAADPSTDTATLNITSDGGYSVAASDSRGGTGSTGQLYGLSRIDVSTAEGAEKALNTIENLIQTNVSAQADFGAAERRVGLQSEFMTSLIDSFTAGIGALVDTDMEAASARLQALQVQQQLAVQSLSIANQAPQTILSLFR